MPVPVLLDLYCCAGGAAKGYADAGFEVVGVDIEPQPHYPFSFVPADVIEFLEGLLAGPQAYFMAVHASPPCQFATDYKRTGNVKDSPNLIPQTRALLERLDLPYVIENVANARSELRDPTLICGSMFDPPLDVQRHRLFETNWDLHAPVWPCRHKVWGPDRFPGGRSKERTGASAGRVRGTVEVGSWDIPLERQKQAMGVDWEITTHELSQAIPPAYTHWIGMQLIREVERRDVDARADEAA
jgi:DNA (cytosine-5)-methyltransferase 1